jgi:hypothetical protein
MTVGEIIEQLSGCEEHQYLLERLKVSDEFIEMVREVLPMDYLLIRDREQEYQRLLVTLSEIKSSNSSISQVNQERLGHDGC